MPEKRTYYPDHILEILNVPEGKREFSSRVAEIIERFHEIVREEKKRIITSFSEDELNFIYDITVDTNFRQVSMIDGKILLNAEKADNSDYKKYKLDKSNLINKLKIMTIATQMTLVEMIRTHWLN